jgi:hypothetical protein
MKAAIATLLAWVTCPVLGGSASSTAVAIEALDTCIPALRHVPLDPATVGQDRHGTAALGTYERISPDGRFVLRSFSGARLGEVSLVELPPVAEESVAVYRTPLSNEAFPVQGTWRYLVDVDGRHFRLSDVLKQQQRAQPLFQGGMKGFYAAAAEFSPVPNPDPSVVWLRSMSWPQGDRMGQGTGPLQVRTLGTRETAQGVSVVHDTGPQFICGSRSSIDGGVFTLPMLSVDGREFSAIPINPKIGQPSMRVYGLSPSATDNTHACDLRHDLVAAPGKAVFGFPGAHPAMLTYTDNASVYFVDRRPGLQDQVFRIEDLYPQVLASAFPGITRDGRIVFGATWTACSPGVACGNRSGYVVADPYQNADYRETLLRRGLTAEKRCITRGDVLRERERFAAERGLQP